MNIVLNSKSSTKGAKNSLQARFDKLQQRLLKQQKINKKFQHELEELMTSYQTHMAQLDVRQLEPHSALANKLIDFFGRKSLSNWHREELAGWIAETIGRIARVNPETADELHSRFRQLVASQMGMTEEEMDEEARCFAEAMEEAFENLEGEEFAADTDFDDDVQADMFGFDEVFEERPSEGGFVDEEDPFDNGFGNTEARQQRLTDDSWARKLFRRAAQALHPDREQDPQQRQAKENAMQQLLTARKQGDILTLQQLYHEGAGGVDLELAEQEMVSACELMEQQLDDLHQEQNDYICEHPLRMLVHELLYSSSRKTREKNIRAWKRSLEAEAQFTVDLIAELRNLKVLKAILEERQEERYLRNFDVMFDDIF